MKELTALNWKKQNTDIQRSIVEGIEKDFPLESTKRILKIENLTMEDKVDGNDTPKIKDIKLRRGTYKTDLYGKVSLIDKNTGKVIDSVDKLKIANVPKMTRWYSMLIDGNEYQTTNQLRLKSGIYTRVKENGDLESRFNLEKGFNFTMILPPDRGIIYLITKNAKYRLYNILYALGVSDEDMRLAWGKELFDKNKQGALNTEQGDIIQLYKELSREQNPDYTTSVEGLSKYFDSTRVSPETTKITLGESFEKVTPKTLLATSKKLINVLRGKDTPDERESLIFKDIYSVEDLATQYFNKNKEGITRKIKYRMDRKDTVREILSSASYSKPIKDFFTKTDLSATSEQTNPAQIIANAQKVTFMGTGGISSKHAVTKDVRDLHPTHLNFIDPLATPESDKTGVNLGLTRDLLKDGHDLKTSVRMLDGSRKFLTVQEFYNMVIGFGDQYALVNKLPVAKTPNVRATHLGKSKMVSAKEVEAWMMSPSNMFGYTTNLIPFIANDSGNRVAMGTRMIGQAIPIRDREAPYVQTSWKGDESFQKIVGNFMNPAPGPSWSGTVSKIDKDYVHLKLDNPDPDTGKTNVKVGLARNYPLNQESFIHNEVKVKVGERVTPNKYLAESNFTKDGVLALGANVNVAYMPWKGLTFEDSAVVSENFSKKFTSEKIVRKNVYLKEQDELNLKKFNGVFPDGISPENVKKLDEHGIVIPGTTVVTGDALVAYLSKTELSDEEKILKQLNRAISKPYKKQTLNWEDDFPGKVLYVTVKGKNIDIYVKVQSPLVVGDKLAGLHGNKAIVSEIVPDDKMPHTKDGERMDMIFSPVSVPGRMNVGQIVEAAAGKLVDKTNKKPILIDNFVDKDQIFEIEKKLKENKIPSEEILLDGKDGRPFETPIFWGKPYILKLRHVVDHKLKSRNIGSYDINLQPSRGRDSGQTLGSMEALAMLSHGAKENLYEAAAIKSQKNDEYWRNLQLGLPTPSPKSNFAFEKMLAYLKQAGVNVEKEGDKITLMPLTDKAVSELSSGKVTDGGQMLIAKNLKTIKGGLFDPEIFGGAGGKKWGHIELAEHIPNPMMEDAIVKALDITQPALEKIIAGEMTLDGLTGFEAIRSGLKKINVKKKIVDLRKELDTAPEQKVNVLNKKIRYMEALDRLGMSPEDYMIKQIPVLPPIYRPIYPLPSGDLMVSPINKHYRDVSLMNDSIKKIKKTGLDDSFNKKNKLSLYNSVKSLQGLVDPITYTQEKYEGAIKTLAGKAPKYGFIHDRLFSKKQDMSARSTVGLDPSLGLDEVGLPDDMLKSLFKPFVMRKLVQTGMRAVDANKAVNEWTSDADRTLDIVIKERPVLLNRAPTLHKHGIQAFKVKRTPSKTIKTNPLINAGFNLDYDGDTMAVHVPIGTEAVNEAWNMLPSKNIFKHGDNSIVPSLSQEYQFGLYWLTKEGKNTGKSFSSILEAERAGLSETDVFELKGKKTTIGKEVINATIPKKYRNYKDPFSKKVVNDILTSIAKESPSNFSVVISSFKDLGHKYAHKRSSTMSISDFTKPRTYRDKILKEYSKKVKETKNDDQKIKLWLEATDKIKKSQDKFYSGKSNVYEWLESGGFSGSKAPNATQILSMPGIVSDVRGNPIKEPILKSYGEGLDAPDYWNTMPGVRRGIVDTAISTSGPGALSKALMGNVWDTVIYEVDCETKEHLEIEVKNNEKDIIDRCLAEDIAGVGRRNDTVDRQLYNKLKKLKIKSVKVRSPLTCKSVKGICQKCYGILPTGQFPDIGYNVGIADAQAVTEKSTQLALRTKHTGAAFAGGTDEHKTVGSFERAVQLLEVPKTIPHKAVLSPCSGKIESKKPDALGGWNLKVGTETVNVPSGKKILVTVGSFVNKGDKLTEGYIKPQELSKLRGHRAAQLQIVDEFDDLYQNDYHKKTFETIIRAVSNNAKIEETPENSTYLRGDTSTIQTLDYENKLRKQQGLAPIKYTPYFKSIAVLPQDREDWLSRVGTNRIVQAIKDSAARGAATHIHGTNPIPGYMYGMEFGKKEDTIY